MSDSNVNQQANENWQLQVFVLKTIAKAKGITQDNIAEKTGIQRSNVSRVFNLKYTPTIKTLNLIAQAVDSYITVVGNGVDMDHINYIAEKELSAFNRLTAYQKGLISFGINIGMRRMEFKSKSNE